MLSQQSEPAAGFAALLGRHLLPSLPVREHSLALRGRQLFELLISLHHLIALSRRQPTPSRILLLQFTATRRRKLAPPAQSFEHSFAFFGWQIAEGLEVLLYPLPIFRTHRLPSLVILEHALTLIGREVGPFPRMLRGERALGVARRHRCDLRLRRLCVRGNRRRKSAQHNRDGDEQTRYDLATRHCCGPSTSMLGTLDGICGTVLAGATSSAPGAACTLALGAGTSPASASAGFPR